MKAPCSLGNFPAGPLDWRFPMNRSTPISSIYRAIVHSNHPFGGTHFYGNPNLTGTPTSIRVRFLVYHPYLTGFSLWNPPFLGTPIHFNEVFYYKPAIMGTAHFTKPPYCCLPPVAATPRNVSHRPWSHRPSEGRCGLRYGRRRGWASAGSPWTLANSRIERSLVGGWATPLKNMKVSWDD